MAQEGDIADGPGGSLIYRGGRWYPHKSSAPDPKHSGGFTGYIPGVPKDPLETQRDVTTITKMNRDMDRDIANDARQAEKDRLDAEEKATKGRNSQDSARYNIDKVIRQIDAIEADAKDNGGWGETGTSGALARKFLPDGSAGFDLAENIKTIDANSAFSALQEMRNNSPTGGALGQVTEKELDLLKSSISNLNPNQSQEQFLANLRIARDAYANMLGRIGGSYQQQGQSPRLAGYGADQVEQTLGQPDKAIGYRFTPAQEKAMRRELEDPDGSPDDYAAMMVDFAKAQGVNVDDAYIQSVNSEAKRIFDAKAKGQPIGPGISYEKSDADYKAGLLNDYDKANPDSELGARQSDLSRAVTQGVTFGLSDEAKGLAGILTGEGYTQSRDRERALNERFAESNPGTAMAANIAGGLVVPMGALGAPARGASVGSRVAQGAKVGAASGALSGFGYGEGVKSVPNALLGAAAGGFAGGALTGAMAGGGRALNALSAARRGPQPTVNAVEIAAAGQAEQVPVNRAMVDPSIANKVTAAESTALGGPVVRGGMQEVSQAIEGRVGALGKGGQALERDVAGEAIQGAGERFIGSSKKVVDRLYNRARTLSGGTTVQPQSAIAAVDQQIAELSQAPETNKAVIDVMEALKSDLSKGGLSIDTLRQIRTGIRGKISSSNVTFSDAERRAGIVLDAASQDIEQSLANNPQALAAYRMADQRHGERLDYIKQVLQPVLGKRDNPLSPAKAMAKIEQWAAPKGDAGRMAALWKSLTPEDAGDISATMASQIGRDKAGEFSPALFISQVEKLSPRARMVAFGKDGAESIKNLITLSNQHRRVMGSLNNSRSGVAMNSADYRNLVMTVLGAGGGGAAGGMTGAAVGAGIGGSLAGKSYFTARMAMSPKIGKWLASAPSSGNPAAIRAHFNRLSDIAAREPAIAGDIQRFQDALLEAAKTAPSRADTRDETTKSGQ